MLERNYHLGFAKVMICGGRYMERHTRFRTLTQTMIFTADLQKGEKMDDIISRQAERRLAAEAEDAAVLQEAISGLTKSMNKVADPESKLFIDESEEE